jgi:putative membrane protein
MKWMLKWLIGSLAVYAAAYLVIGIQVKTPDAAFTFSLVLGLVNLLGKPLLGLLLIPLRSVGPEALAWLVSTILFYWVGGWIDGIIIPNFWTAILGAGVITIINQSADLYWVSKTPASE